MKQALKLKEALDFCAMEGISYYCAIGPTPHLHSHQWLELAYLDQGSILHSVGGVSYTVNAGDYFIVEYDQPHNYISLGEDGIRLTNIMFHPRFIDPTLADAHSMRSVFNHYLIHFNEAQLSKTPTLTKFSDPTGSIRNYIEDIIREITQAKTGWRESVRGLLIYIIIQTLREITSADGSRRTLDFSRRIVDYVGRNYMNSIKISDAFDSGQYSTSYLSKRFKKEMGLTFSEYLKHVRIDESCRMLVRTDKSVSEISEQVGYGDTTFFHNNFRRIMGCTPLEYRKNRPTKLMNLTEYAPDEEA